jgi:hypothetical protein
VICVSHGRAAALAGQPHHVITCNGLALVCHTQEITAVRGGGNGHGARDAQFDVLAAIRGGDDVRQYSEVYCALSQLAP